MIRIRTITTPVRAARASAILFTTLVVSTVAQPDTANAQTATGVIVGRALAESDGTPVVGASVTLSGANRSASTDAQGRFVFSGLAPATYRLRVQRVGFRPITRDVELRANDTLRLDLRLLATVQQLGEVRTDARATEREQFAARPDVSRAIITARSAATVPKIAEGDIVRVVQLQPGVEARNDFSTGLNVRGGESDQNLVLIDGYPVYNPFHLGGLFSTFIDASVRDATLLTGAMPAQFGGRLSSVLDVRSAEEERSGVHGRVDLSVLAATGQVGSSANDGRTAWSAATRRTFADQAVNLFSDDLLPYHFRDLHAHARHDFTNGTRLSVTAYNGADVWDADLSRASVEDETQTRAGDGRFLLEWGNTVVGATLSGQLSRDRSALLFTLPAGSRWEQRLSRSSFSALLNAGEGSRTLRSTLADVRALGIFTAVSMRHALSVGYELSSLRSDFSDGTPAAGGATSRLQQSAQIGALFIDDIWRPTDRWTVQAGLRAERASNHEWAAVSPRLSVKRMLTPDLAITAATGRAYQFTHSLVNEEGPLRLLDTWIISDDMLPVAGVWQHSVGIEARAAGGRSMRIEGFSKRYDNVAEANPSQDPLIVGDEFRTLDGSSYGADLLLRQDGAGAFTGWLAYTYAVNTRERDGVRWFPAQDRRHYVNIVASWRLGRTLIGSRFGFASGLPYTEIVGQLPRRVFDPVRNSWGTGGASTPLEYLGGSRNAARLPATQRLDVSVSRAFERGRRTITPYVSLVNAYNARNIWFYLYDYETDSPTRRAVSQFPILPSLGVSVAF